MITVKTSENEEQIVNLEMQNYDSTDVICRRAQAYVAELLIWQLSKGDNKYQLKKINQIMLLKHKKFNDEGFVSQYLYKKLDSNIVLKENRSWILFVELSKLRNLDITNASELEKVCYFLRYAHVKNKHDIISLLIKENEVLRMFEKRRESYMYDISERLFMIKEYFDDWTFETEKEDAKEEGIKIGIKQGFEQGIEQSIIKLYAYGMSVEEISRVYEMSIEDIVKIVE